jgi:hypothetical protein
MVSLNDSCYSPAVSPKLKKGDIREDGYRFWKYRKWKRKDGTATITGLWLSPIAFLKEENANRERSRINSAKKRKRAGYKEKHAAYCAERYKNPEIKKRLLEYRSQWKKKKAAKDPAFALRDLVRRRISESLKNIGKSKNKRTEEILGCSSSFFCAYIKARFQDGMSWENKGKWHIDHIVPVSSAKTEQDVIKLNHYTNLRPMWASDNIKKSNKMPSEQLELIESR